MPFTLAHPAAVLPLWRRLHHPGEMSAAVIGSMAPDFVFWLPLPIDRDTSHSILGLFLFCLPTGVMALWLYQTLIRDPIVALLPRAISVRLPLRQPILWRLRNVVRVLLALLLGAVTHIVWDAFTHDNTLITRQFPFFATPLLIQNGYTLRVYMVLQHGSALVGLGVITFYAWRWYQSTPPRNASHPENLLAWQKASIATCLIVPSVIGAVQNGLYKAPREASLQALQVFSMAAFVAGIGIFILVLCILGLLWPLVERREW
ncbi:MAG: hypothetical protein ETSY1_34875 [Candidatus Entotheonella factor]|uniref:DUF4184 domain-containing protein n=1 Tax=Entotheonella factor TaxID=1429438 RepID=W4L8M3_ENTF1|nr:DUF4184 family protein [Candidatus Entotheonella palauensis]ETW94428.1 MAG: hypothetical protein ETSY1_34875 [Candidatus Entotheonella factor]